MENKKRELEALCIEEKDEVKPRNESFLEEVFKDMDNPDVISQCSQTISTIATSNLYNRLLGIFFQIVCALGFALTVFFCKLAYKSNSNLTGFDYVLLRSLSMFILSVVQVLYLKVNVFDIKKGYRFILFGRCICAGIGMPIYFIGLKYISKY